MATIRTLLLIFLASLSFSSNCQDIRIDMAKKYCYMLNQKLHMYPDKDNLKKAYIETVYVMKDTEMFAVKKQKYLPKDSKFLSLVVVIKDKTVKRYFLTFEDFEKIKIEKKMSDGLFLSLLYRDNFLFTYDEKSDGLVLVSVD